MMGSTIDCTAICRPSSLIVLLTRRLSISVGNWSLSLHLADEWMLKHGVASKRNIDGRVSRGGVRNSDHPDVASSHSDLLIRLFAFPDVFCLQIRSPDQPWGATDRCSGSPRIREAQTNAGAVSQEVNDAQRPSLQTAAPSRHDMRHVVGP